LQVPAECETWSVTLRAVGSGTGADYPFLVIRKLDSPPAAEVGGLVPCGRVHAGMYTGAAGVDKANCLTFRNLCNRPLELRQIRGCDNQAAVMCKQLESDRGVFLSGRAVATEDHHPVAFREHGVIMPYPSTRIVTYPFQEDIPVLGRTFSWRGQSLHCPVCANVMLFPWRALSLGCLRLRLSGACSQGQ
jgi:hypothetical protein